MKVPFAPPRIDNLIINEVVDTLRSGWITTGPKTKRFEQELTQYTGAKKTVCLGSATAGLELVLRWFGVGSGDEVIVPAYTYCATANVVLHCGAKPIMVDVNPSDYNIELSQLAKAITNRTKAIIPVDFGGNPCDYAALNRLVQEQNSRFVPSTEMQKRLGRILILADAAHSFGASYKGHKAGALTDISVFSFHAVKNLATAEGGAVVFNLPEHFDHEKLYQEFCVKSLHGQSKDALAKTSKGGWRYDVLEAGYKCNMTDIQASLGLVELGRYDAENLPKRKYICERYLQAFSNKRWANLPVFKNISFEGSYHLFPLRISGITESERDSIIDELASHEISVNVHFLPLPLLSLYKNKGYNIQNYPVAQSLFEQTITLPVFFDITDAQIDFVIEKLIECVEKHLN